MNTLIQLFRVHFFSYTIVVLLILAISVSFYRFMVIRDYIVSYEGNCDPYTESCFVYCEDDECTEPVYYSTIERQANEIFERCGEDVTLCNDAYECQPDVEICTITFCNPIIDNESCESLTEEDYVEDESMNDQADTLSDIDIELHDITEDGAVTLEETEVIIENI